MGQINFHASLDFPVFEPPPSLLFEFAWSFQQRTYYFDPTVDGGIKIVR